MELSGQSQRWQGQRSAFSWEQSALDHIKAQMPEVRPIAVDGGETRRVACYAVMAILPLG
jgi:hypothetical protein